MASVTMAVPWHDSKPPDQLSLLSIFWSTLEFLHSPYKLESQERGAKQVGTPLYLCFLESIFVDVMFPWEAWSLLNVSLENQAIVASALGTAHPCRETYLCFLSLLPRLEFREVWTVHLSSVYPCSSRPSLPPHLLPLPVTYATTWEDTCKFIFVFTFHLLYSSLVS